MNTQLILSVLIGAAIGYITNYIAIKLLFRPYKPLRFFGITIFPAGVIPREKKTLAKKVGNIVSNYIFSEEEIKKLVSNEGVKKEIESFLDKKLDEFLSADVTELVSKDEFAKNLANIVDGIIQNRFPMFSSFLTKEQLQRLFKELDFNIKLQNFADKNVVKEKLLNEIELFLERELPKILLKAHIDKIVEEKVASFDEAKLEDMLFVLMKKHFGFINFAGAALGGIIGLVQYFVVFQ